MALVVHRVGMPSHVLVDFRFNRLDEHLAGSLAKYFRQHIPRTDCQIHFVAGILVHGVSFLV